MSETTVFSYWKTGSAKLLLKEQKLDLETNRGTQGAHGSLAEFRIQTSDFREAGVVRTHGTEC